MISMSSFPPRPARMRFPTAPRPRLNLRVKASFTMATFGAPAASARVKSRPARSGTPRVRKKPGPTRLNAESVSASGPASKPSTDTPLLQLLPEMSGTIEAATPVTPGTAPSSSSMRSNRARDWSGV
jgi:hypothetical protein